jgi:hypothetical protein
MMPAATYQIPGGARVLIFTCEGCGDPAGFGYGVNILSALAATNREEAIRRAGRWYCARHPDGSGYCAKTGVGSAGNS